MADFLGYTCLFDKGQLNTSIWRREETIRRPVVNFTQLGTKKDDGWRRSVVLEESQQSD